MVKLAPAANGWGFLLPGPLIQHARPLSDGQPDTRPMLGHAVEDAAGLVQAAAGEQQLGDLLPVARPLLDLVEVAPVGVDRIVSLFVRPVVHYT